MLNNTSPPAIHTNVTVRLTTKRIHNQACPCRLPSFLIEDYLTQHKILQFSTQMYTTTIN